MTFPEGYHSNTRTDLAPFLPPGRGFSVLELGCGEGRTGQWLKATGFARRVVGVEQHVAAAALARGSAALDQVYEANLNDFDLPGDETFDIVLAADVLEHLVDPGAVLRRLVTRVRPGGWVVSSTPNVRYWKVIADLAVLGRWDYGSNVILDPTHLRFFTLISIRRLHEAVGLSVELVGHLELSGKRRWLDRLTGGGIRDFLCGQHVIRSVKPRV